MKTTFSSSPSIFLLHFVLISSSLITTQCSDLIEQTCKMTPFYDLCVTSLRSGSQSATTDVRGFAVTMANVLLGNTTNTLDYIEGLIKQSRDPEMEHALANCAELYIPVVKYNIPQAMDALRKGDFAFADYAISDAGKQADACEKGFSGSDASPLTDRNKLVRNLCDVAVAILKILMKG